ncbi:MAG: M23 family metallopeptidase [Candidatus Rokuibacteriota bacterium]
MSDRIRLVLALVAVMVVLGTAGLTTQWWLGSEAPAPEPPAPAETAAPPAPEPPSERLQTVTLRRGDSLVLALTRAGLEPRIGHEVATALARAGVDLRRLKPGDTVEITWSGTDKPMAVSLQPSPWLGYAAVAEEDGWTVKRLETTPDVRLAMVQGRVERSLFEAVDQAGESPPLVLAVVNIFEWDFDFTADTRSGDRFRLLVEKRYAGDTFVSYGRVLAAQYASDRRTLTAIGYTPGRDRFGYYDLDGRSLKKSFLKSPLEFSRITSRFTYARPHPILGGTLPHLAVDYAAPMGTPVRAVADGVVAHAGRDGGYGIAVRLRHRSGYETLYAHLSRVGPGIDRGARVGQRQVIGYVGSTGLSTGPHLHYEVMKSGHRVNPLGEKFIPGEPIPSAERGVFDGHARELITRLETEAPL